MKDKYLREINPNFSVVELIAEKFDDYDKHLTPNAIVFGGAVRDILAGLPLEGDLDVAICKAEFPTIIKSLLESPRWQKTLNKGEIKKYKASFSVDSIVTFENLNGSKVQIITPTPSHLPEADPFVEAISIVRQVDILCCALFLDSDGNIFEVIPGAEEDCKKRVLRLAKKDNPDLNKIKERINKLVSRGWVSEIDLSKLFSKSKKSRITKKQKIEDETNYSPYSYKAPYNYKVLITVSNNPFISSKLTLNLIKLSREVDIASGVLRNKIFNFCSINKGYTIELKQVKQEEMYIRSDLNKLLELCTFLKLEPVILNTLERESSYHNSEKKSLDTEPIRGIIDFYKLDQDQKQFSESIKDKITESPYALDKITESPYAPESTLAKAKNSIENISVEYNITYSPPEIPKQHTSTKNGFDPSTVIVDKEFFLIPAVKGQQTEHSNINSGRNSANKDGLYYRLEPATTTFVNKVEYRRRKEQLDIDEG